MLLYTSERLKQAHKHYHKINEYIELITIEESWSSFEMMQVSCKRCVKNHCIKGYRKEKHHGKISQEDIIKKYHKKIPQDDTTKRYHKKILKENIIRW